MTDSSITDKSTRHPVTVLLVDDQPIVGEAVRRMLASESDIVFHFCSDPSRAIDTATTVQPTVILQDLVMPGIDGLTLVKQFRANEGTRQVPMIVLSTKEEPVIKAQAFALGANDYLVKLPDKIELIARIRYHSRSYLNQVERDEAYRRLAESERLMAEELAQASRYVQSLLPPPLEGEVSAQWRFVPSTQLGGDILGYHWLDADHLAVYLLDVSGHGVGSSLLAVSATNLLSSQALPDTDFRDPGKLLSRLNDVFQMEKQNGKYFTIWYGVYRKKDRSLVYCNAAHPAPLLWSGPSLDPSQLTLLKSTDPVIGMCPPGMPFETKSVQLGPKALLLVYSDGAYEIEKPEGGMWKHQEFVQFVKTLPLDGASLGEQLLTHVRQMHGSEILADDFSVLEVRF
ncbi:MAG TPA: SpoIIE family protein phosphatase [Gemmataceae bacterium]|jgi:sigma-B regulation protein RsbU (phosphoserine phosphatase)